jgi:hypothetical protein
LVRLGSSEFEEVGFYYFLFGSGQNVLTETKVAIKVENRRNPHPQLEYEARVYKYLAGTRKFCFWLEFFVSFIPF